MTVRTSIGSGDSASRASAALLGLLICCASGGTVGQIYTFDPGDDVSASIGGGIGADEAYGLLRQTGGRIRVILAEPTWASAPSVTKSGSGPTVSVALADGALGPFDNFKIVFTVVRGGAGGSGAAFDAAYDGSTVIETLPVPAETPAVIQGLGDVSNGADLEGLSLEFTSPSSDTLTFPAGSLVAAGAGLKAATATSASPVTLTASGLLTAGKAAILDNPRRVSFTTGGVTPANAPATATVTGTLYGAPVVEIVVLSQTAGTLHSESEFSTITSIAYAAGDGTAATVAIGYLSAYPTADSIAAAFNTLATSASYAATASIAQASTGESYLVITSTGVGGGTTITMDDGASDAAPRLGFADADDNTTASGGAAMLTPPWTGLTFTFPTNSDYVVGTTYTTACTGPRASIGAIVAAATAARNDYQQNPFGYICVGQPADTAANCQALESALATLQAEWLANPYNGVFVDFVVGSQFHVANSNSTTNSANIATADTALSLAFQAASANFGNVAVDDVYLPGSTSLRFGSYRRTAAMAWAEKRGTAQKIAADVADQLLPEGTLLGPDLLTKARNEATATTKLGGGSGPGFSALRATSAGLGFVKFAPGATRAGPTSRLRFIGPLSVGFEIARIVFPLLELWEGETVASDPLTGQMADAVKQERQNSVYTLIEPTLLPTDGSPNVTPYPGNKACNVQILNPSTGRFIDNGQVRVRISYLTLGEIEEVFLMITAAGVVLSEAA